MYRIVCANCQLLPMQKGDKKARRPLRSVFIFKRFGTLQALLLGSFLQQADHGQSKAISALVHSIFGHMFDRELCLAADGSFT